MPLYWLVCHLLVRLALWIRFRLATAKKPFRRRRTTTEDDASTAPSTPRIWKSRPKPPWVRQEVLQLKALMPDLGCRKIADTFCYLYAAQGENVGRTFVATLVKTQGEAIVRLRREMKNRVPKKVPKNLIWALDLTFLPTPGGDSRPVLGVLDHGSRACLALRTLTTRRSIDILRVLFDLVGTFGKPKILRTDNEPIFTSWLFRTALWLLGIRHRRSAPFAPWQNGRIERIFLTLKDRIRIWTRNIAEIEQTDLDLFRAWYNGVRPHQHLEGHIVPAEAWAGKKLRSSRPRYFNAWDGALTGFYWPEGRSPPQPPGGVRRKGASSCCEKRVAPGFRARSALEDENPAPPDLTHAPLPPQNRPARLE